MVYFDEVDHLHRFVNQVNEVRAHKSGLFNVERILIVNNGFESWERLKDILPVGVTLLDNPHRSLACARQMIIDHCNEDFYLVFVILTVNGLGKMWDSYTKLWLTIENW